MASLYSKYNRLLISQPLLTNSITTGFLFGSGDYLAQKITDNNSKYDFPRTIRAVIYGSVIFAPIGDRWYKLLNKLRAPYISRSYSSQRKLKIYDTLTRVAADQLIFAPFIGIPIYYTAMTAMKLEQNSIEAIKDILKKNWWSTIKHNWYVWPSIQLLNFGFIPVQLRLLVVNLVSIGWNCYLSLLLYHKDIKSIDEDQIMI